MGVGDSKGRAVSSTGGNLPPVANAKKDGGNVPPSGGRAPYPVGRSSRTTSSASKPYATKFP